MKLNPFDGLNFVTKNGIALANFLLGEYAEAQTWVQKR
jgi:hypothetical protein